jgi:hypothetical protein
MFQDNWMLQFVSGVMLGLAFIMFVTTFIPAFGYEKQIESPNLGRVLMLLVMLGLLRGAF